MSVYFEYLFSTTSGNIVYIRFYLVAPPPGTPVRLIPIATTSTTAAAVVKTTTITIAATPTTAAAAVHIASGYIVATPPPTATATVTATVTDAVITGCFYYHRCKG